MFKKREEIKDKVIVVLGEQLSVYPVIKSDEVGVHTEFHVFPLADAVRKFQADGGVIYMYYCDLPYLQETQHLKQVEENLVIRNIFDFGWSERNHDLRFYIMAGLLILTIFFLR